MTAEPEQVQVERLVGLLGVVALDSDGDGLRRLAWGEGQRAGPGGTTKVCWIVSCWRPITSGKRSPARSCTSKISSTAVWNSNRARPWPLRKSTTATPHFNCSRRWARGTPSIADVWRIFDRPTKAYGPDRA